MLHEKGPDSAFIYHIYHGIYHSTPPINRGE